MSYKKLEKELIKAHQDIKELQDELLALKQSLCITLWMILFGLVYHIITI